VGGKGGGVFNGLDHGFHAGNVFARASLNFVHCAAHILGCRHGFFRQFAHLIGHHGKAPPRITCARSLNGGVKRKQVGLVGDVCNDVHDLPDAVCLFAQHRHVFANGKGVGAYVFNAFDRLVYNGGAVLSLPARLGRGAGSPLGVSGDLKHGGVHFFHGCGGFPHPA